MYVVHTIESVVLYVPTRSPARAACSSDSPRLYHHHERKGIEQDYLETGRDREIWDEDDDGGPRYGEQDPAVARRVDKRLTDS